MTGGEPQPPLLLVVVVEQRIAPGHQALAQAAEARLALGDLGRRREQRVLLSHRLRQLIEQIALAQPLGRKGHLRALHPFQQAIEDQRADRQRLAPPPRYMLDAVERRLAEAADQPCEGHGLVRSEEHTSELQSLMRISYAVFCLKKKK